MDDFIELSAAELQLIESIEEKHLKKSQTLKDRYRKHGRLFVTDLTVFILN